MPIAGRTPEVIAEELSQLVRELVEAGRNDLLLRSIGVPVLEELRMEAAKRAELRVRRCADWRHLAHASHRPSCAEGESDGSERPAL